MKILFVTYDFPYPTNSGGKMRAYNLLKYAGKDADITVYSFVRENFDRKNIDKLLSIGVKHVEVFPRRKVLSISNAKAVLPGISLFKALYDSSDVKRKIWSLVEKEHIDILHCESYYTSFYIDPGLTKKGVKQIYGSENIEHKLYDEYIKQNVFFPLRPAYYLQAKKIKDEELQAAKIADTTLAVTPAETAYFESLSGKKAYTIENGVALSEFPFHVPKKREGINILYVGNFNYFPNLAAVEFFYSQVFRHLSHDKLQLTILGKGSSRFETYNDKRLQLIEYIEDITDAYKNADIFVSPVRIGGGTNFKILEAMASGVPVVTFSDRVRDIGAKHGHDVLTADTAEAFIQEVTSLIEDSTLRETLARNARRIIEDKFSWEGIGENLNKVWKDLHESR